MMRKRNREKMFRKNYHSDRILSNYYSLWIPVPVRWYYQIRRGRYPLENATGKIEF